MDILWASYIYLSINNFRAFYASYGKNKGGLKISIDREIFSPTYSFIENETFLYLRNILS